MDDFFGPGPEEGFDGPMKIRAHILKNDLLTRAIHEMNEACEQRNISAIHEATEHFSRALDYLPEHMPMHVLATRLGQFNELHNRYGSRPELFDEEYQQFHNLLRQEMTNRE